MSPFLHSILTANNKITQNTSLLAVNEHDVDVNDRLISELLSHAGSNRGVATSSPSTALSSSSLSSSSSSSSSSAAAAAALMSPIGVRERENLALELRELIAEQRVNRGDSLADGEFARRRLEREQRERELSERETQLLAAVADEEKQYAAELRSLDAELSRQREAERLGAFRLVAVVLLVVCYGVLWCVVL